MKVIFTIALVVALMMTNSAYAHKLILHDESHRDFDSALNIPDHKISWAVYENLGANKAKYYKFDALKGDSLYASLVIPKMEGLEEYAPTMFLVSNEFQGDSIESQDVQKYPYVGEFPSSEFYEPFGQVTYWERQEITTEIPTDGQYFIVVSDEKNQSGKYSLAIGTIEDFSGEDFLTILPQAWFETKLFVNDYASIAVFFAVIISIIAIPILVALKKKFKRGNIVELKSKDFN
ncbi:MAG: hypothetical protein HKM23_07670 [Nitrosopumilus sp.]|nr:hypothetical protein [Nitrosopumilus sp.]NNL59375.1 hypothetical protein [Nitrosopumilus sp.]